MEPKKRKRKKSNGVKQVLEATATIAAAGAAIYNQVKPIIRKMRKAYTKKGPNG